MNDNNDDPTDILAQDGWRERLAPEPSPPADRRKPVTADRVLAEVLLCPRAGKVHTCLTALSPSEAVMRVVAVRLAESEHEYEAAVRAWASRANMNLVPSSFSRGSKPVFGATKPYAVLDPGPKAFGRLPVALWLTPGMVKPKVFLTFHESHGSFVVRDTEARDE